MDCSKARRILALFLSVLMMAGTLSLSVFADGTDDAVTASAPDTGNQISLQDINDVISTPSYTEYKKMHKDAPDASKTVNIDLSDIDEENSSGTYEVKDTFEGSAGKVLVTGNDAKVTLNFDVPESAMYTLKFDYRAVTDKAIAIKRSISINGETPFSQARSLVIRKTWVQKRTELEDGTVRFALDRKGNEIRPRSEVLFDWQSFVFMDPKGYETEPLKFYLEEGHNTITIKSLIDDAAITDLCFDKVEKLDSLETKKAEYESKGYKSPDTDVIRIEGEMPYAASDYSIYPLNEPNDVDASPQSPKCTLLNTIGGSYYVDPGQWIEYEFEIEESGLYNIAARYSALLNPYTSRIIYIDGEVPFEEARDAWFMYDSSEGYLYDYVTSESGPLEFYLEKGKHTIRFEGTIGKMGEIYSRMTAVQSSLNEDYLAILRLTGASPDEYTDYGFGRVMPDTMRDLVKQAKELRAVVEYFEGMSGLDTTTRVLTEIADRVYKMGTNEDEVAKNLEGMKSDLGSLGSFTQVGCGLTFDYIDFVPSDRELEDNTTGFFGSMWFGISKFFSTFVNNNDTMSSDTDDEDVNSEAIEVWTSSGREKAQMIKNLIDSDFVPESDIPVNLKLVADGTLLPSVLAGIGPDVALGMTATNGAATSGASGTINDYAIRGAVLPLQNFEDFDEVKSKFQETVFESFSLYDNVYGLPFAFEWNMMFYRSDILSKLNIDVPETWDDLMASVPVLQFNNMEIGLPSDTAFFATLTYQRGGEYWADGGMRVNFDSNTSLEAFETMCNMFTQYSLPLTFDASNRFRTGEIPLFIGGYVGANNSITIFATEIEGLWGFGLVPGTVQEDGSVNRTIIGSSDGIIMLKDCVKRDETWEFMKWYVDDEFQMRFANEQLALLGSAAKTAPANLDILDRLSWTKEELDVIMEQVKYVKCLRQYPGSYFITRYVGFAVQNAYNLGMDPAEQMLGYINQINHELSRKREEFDLETLEVGQTLATKREGQALDALNALEQSVIDKYKDLIEKAKTAIESEEPDEIRIGQFRDIAAELQKADAEVFGEIAGYLNDAADALESYR